MRLCVKQLFVYLWILLNALFTAFRNRVTKRVAPPQKDAPSAVVVTSKPHVETSRSAAQIITPGTFSDRTSVRRKNLTHRLASMASASSAGSSSRHSDVMSQQTQFHKKAFKYISEALEIDESTSDVSKKTKALELYRKGISELERGVQLTVTGTEVDAERANRLHDKMAHSLQQSIERVQVLESELLKMSTASDGGSSVDGAKDSTTQPAVSSAGTKPHESREPSTKADKTNPAVSNVRPRSARSRTPPSGRNNQAGRTSVTQPGRRQPADSTAGRLSKEAPKKPTETPAARPLSAANMKNVDSKLAHIILNEIVDVGSGVTFNDIAGQAIAKQALQEIVILPALRPEMFTGLRAPARGLLLFGPPGNGKTMLAKAVAHESQAKFFNISAASLTSKWMGEGEKLVRALFALAKELQPSIVFMDEVDSLLCERREGEHDGSRRIKTQFLLEFDGVHSNSDDRVLIMGATNRPFELDDAVLRRFPKRLFIQTPDQEARIALLAKLLSKQDSPLSVREIAHIASKTEGYSSSDLTALAKDAALGPIRELGPNLVKSMDVSKVRKITVDDFIDSLRRIRCSVPNELLGKLENWNQQYGDIST